MHNVCLVGYGYWGEKLARNFDGSENFNIISIVDINKKNLDLAKRKYTRIIPFKNYKSAIQSSTLDLVVISTPTSTHFRIAKFALENGKHVLVEKPLSLSLKEVKKLNNIAKINRKSIFVDYPFLFSGTINYIKKIVDNKKFGKIKEIESFREKAPIRKDANVIWDLSTHDISILTYLLNSAPHKIQTIKKNNLKKHPIDTVYINLKYKNNMNVLIKNSWISPTKIRVMKIKFEKAILFCDENESMYKIKIYKKNKNNPNNYTLEIPDLDLTEPLLKIVKYISKSINKNENKLFSNNFNEKVTHLLERINKNND